MNFFDSIEDLQIVPPFHKTSKRITYSQIRVSSTSVRLSANVASELGYPEFITMAFSKAKQLLIVAPYLNIGSKIPFHDSNDGEKHIKKSVLINHPLLAKQIRTRMGWGSKGIYKISGTMVEEKVIAFFMANAKTGKEKIVNPSESQIADNWVTWADLKKSLKPLELVSQNPEVDIDHEKMETNPNDNYADVKVVPVEVTYREA